MKTNKPLWKIIASWLLVMAVMGLAVPGSAARGSQATSAPLAIDPPLCQVYSPNAGMVNVLNAVSAPLVTTASDQPAMWAVGYVSNPNALLPRTNTLAMRYDGKAWNIVPSPNVSRENYLNSVAVRNWNDAWAVGYYVDDGSERALLMRFTGRSWAIAQLPPEPAVAVSTQLNGVTTFGEKEAVAVGYYSYGPEAPRPLALYFDGKSWAKMEVPMLGKSGKLYGVASDGTNIWAVGSISDDSGDVALLYRYDGKTWSAIAKGDGYLTSVAVSDAGVFTVGDVVGTSGKETLAMLYNPTSGSFDRVPSFNLDTDHNFLTSVATNGKEVYAVGYSGVLGNDNEMLPLVLRYNGKTFTPLQTPHPSVVDKLAGVTVSAKGLWAVGSSMKGEYGRSTLILSNRCVADW